MTLNHPEVTQAALRILRSGENFHSSGKPWRPTSG